MKKQAAEAKPETKDIKAEEQKPKVPAPQWVGVFLAPASTLEPTCTSGRSRNAPARTLTQLLDPRPNQLFQPSFRPEANPPQYLGPNPQPLSRLCTPTLPTLRRSLFRSSSTPRQPPTPRRAALKARSALPY